MFWTVVGFRRYDFKDERGTQRKGYNIYLTGSQDGVEGIVTEKVSLTDDKLAGYVPQLDDVIRIGFDRYQRASFVVPVA